ncbi:hypothetical protein QA025_gp60 [Salmonella virus VSe101]|uniref:Uncharacterized protein n=1 Tax=Salmonella virus VSe101 TaxID=2653660 RepID=A0A5P8PNI7_9CAUD|nr:hypothetical protein QA025_gp60 [Salmonella virus VSe101]QFR58912.1 hypothetical protein vse101_60 [Salmonella virus VSe101]
MSKSAVFYAVVEKDSLACVSLIHERYGEVKAIFPDKEKAQKVIDNYPDEGLRVVAVHISTL